MRVLRRRAPVGRAGLRAARAPRLDGRADPARRPRLRAGAARARRRPDHQRPLPERRPPERRQPHLARPCRRRAARLRREPGAPRRRRRRRTRQHRRLPRGVPGGRDHPAGQARRGGADRRGRFHARAGPDPLEARDRRRLPRADRREQHRRAAAAGSGRAPRPRDDRGDHARAPRLHGAAHARRACRSAARNLGGRGLGRRRRLQRRAGPPEGPRHDRPRRRALRHVGLRPSAPRPGQLDLRADLLRLRVRTEVPDRPRPARQRRLLPADRGRRARRDGDELPVAEPGRRRLGDPDSPRRRDLPRPPPRAAGAAPGGDEGDDVPCRLRRGRLGHGELLLLPRDVRRRVRRPRGERRPRRGAGPRPEHRERARRGDGAQLPRSRSAALAGRGLRRRREVQGRPRAAQGLPLRPPHDVHRPRRPHARAAPPARSAASTAARPSTCSCARGEEQRLSAKCTIELEAGDVVSYRTCGGGGYGPPGERDPELVRRDVREGKVSAERARDVYGVEA